MTDPSDETRATPKLNRGTLENLLGFFDSFAAIFANEEPVPDKMNLGSDKNMPGHLACVLPRRPPMRKKVRSLVSDTPMELPSKHHDRPAVVTRPLAGADNKQSKPLRDLGL